MNPKKVDRSRIARLTDMPNVGKSIAADFESLGITDPGQLAGRCPFALYEALCEKTGCRQDPCVLDVFISITRFLAGEEARPWWEYTQERKQLMEQKLKA